MRAIRTMLTIVHSAPLADKLIFDYSQSNDDVNSLYWLADQDPDLLTDEKLEDWIRHHAETLYHPVSSFLCAWILCSRL